MCITTGPAELSSTVVYAGEARVNGEYVHVLGYQNKAKNKTGTPNAMVFPIPASARMSPRNVVDTSECKNILRAYAYAVDEEEHYRGMSKGISKGSHDVAQVFESGMYTVVLARDAMQIPEALERVDKTKRPEIKMELLEAFDEWYAGWHFAVCCFQATAVEPDPMVWWYKPMNPDMLFFPTLDSHSGGVPEVGKLTRLDHSLIAGSTSRPAGDAVSLRRGEDLSNVNQYLPSLVIGKKYSRNSQTMNNGDHYLHISDLRDQHFRPSTMSPPGYQGAGHGG